MRKKLIACFLAAALSTALLAGCTTPAANLSEESTSPAESSIPSAESTPTPDPTPEPTPEPTPTPEPSKSLSEQKKDCKKYEYKKLARDPESYVGKSIKFSGEVIQAVESNSSDTITYRIAQDGDYDKVFLVVYERPEGASKILEDDDVTVYGLFTGDYTYETTLGGPITVPSLYAFAIDLKD